MPIYEYVCSICESLFEILTPRMDNTATCPSCGGKGYKKISRIAQPVIKTRERLPYGTGSRGKFIPAEETGGLSIFVPSFGAMEKEEVDEVASIAVEKERERVAKNKPLNERNAQTKQALGNIVKIGKSQSKGKRHKTMELVKKEGLR